MVRHRIKTWDALKKVIILKSTVALIIVNDVFLQLLENCFSVCLFFCLVLLYIFVKIKVVNQF